MPRNKLGGTLPRRPLGAARSPLSNLLPAASFVLFIAGALLVFEVIRPFRNLAIDGPIAVGCWSAGLLLSVAAVWLRRGSRALGVIAVVLNLLALAVISVVLYGLSHLRLF